MKRLSELIAGTAFAASLVFTKGVAPLYARARAQENVTAEIIRSVCKDNGNDCKDKEKNNKDGEIKKDEKKEKRIGRHKKPRGRFDERFGEEKEKFDEGAFEGAFEDADEGAEKPAFAKKGVPQSEDELAHYAKSAYLLETHSKTVVFSKEETKRLPIASMCKIMTLLLCFDAINAGELSMNETIVVSENAAGMGGSQVFLEAGGEYSVRELMKSVAVCSANDSCVALAERIAGNESAFVDKMNARAKELGAENTLFANCTGLPKEPQYSCAKDVAAMLGELISNEEYFALCKVWTEKFEHPKGRTTEMTNTNRLVRFYPGCDGGKTGFTGEAGFCLAATASRGGMRLISVVIGADTGKHRFDDVRGMFDYAFASYCLKTVVDDNNPLAQKLNLRGGKTEEISVRPARGSYIFGKRGEKEDVTTSTTLPEYVSAPVKAGDTLGEIVVFSGGVEIDRVPLVANETALRANFFDRFKDVAREWR
ncbi:MAG: D-alanyl-D-alanine carboxypeptidase family protein [Candidatus Borkfalkiaceae bacterium]|nr:D-alanyl-D-alanine carboxypeptidase [Clostridia bacterium]MDY6224003.1 D-alanyl-D-alanine carboxypeptidase family protein [Christensenellaceae bacterium]